MPRAKKEDIVDIIVKINDRKLAEDFLSDILSPAEREDIEQRWKLVQMLNKGIPQRKIAKKLGVSLCKITRGSRELKYGSGALKKLLNE